MIKKEQYATLSYWKGVTRKVEYDVINIEESGGYHDTVAEGKIRGSSRIVSWDLIIDMDSSSWRVLYGDFHDEEISLETARR